MPGNVPSWQNLGPRFSNGSLHENLRVARQISCAASLHGKLYNKNAHSIYGGECDAAIAKAAAAVTHVQSQSQEVGSGDEGLGLLCFDVISRNGFLVAGGRAVETSPLLSSENC